MREDEMMADALLGGNVGAVGAVDVQPRIMRPGTQVGAPYQQWENYVGQPAVAPRYVGAPAQALAVQQPLQQPVNYAPMEYMAGDVTLMGLGYTVIPAGSISTPITLKPIKPFTPQKLGCPSTVQDLLLKTISIGGTNIFANIEGVAIELLSEVSTFPQIDWPTLDPAVGIEFGVGNPTAADLVFKGALYGTAVRR